MNFPIRGAMVLLVMLNVAAAGGKRPAYVIETISDKADNPMPALDLKRLKEGKLPRFWDSFSIPTTIGYAGFARYRGHRSNQEKGLIHWHRSNPQIMLQTYADQEISLDSCVTHVRSFGMKVVRGPDGEVLQAASLAEVFFFSRQDFKVTVDSYRAVDCETNREGMEVPRAGAKRNFRFEQWEDTKESGAHARGIHYRLHWEDGRPDKSRSTAFSKSSGRSQVSDIQYSGKTETPENLTQRNSIQRVRWPEGPGYRQIKKEEDVRPGGGMVLKSQVMEFWRVGNDGSRTLVKTENMLKPGPPGPRQADPAQTF